MREIVLDTETTGLDPKSGDRIVEIGCVELDNHLPTGRTYHQYVNPERDMPDDAFRVHGLSEAFLAKHPVFSDIADLFLEFIGDADLVIHNASFDLGFINAELLRLGRAPVDSRRAIDTVQVARGKYPGAQASLDALCRRFEIDLSARTKHGALLDAELLADVYLELIGGRQPGFDLASQRQNSVKKINETPPKPSRPPRPHAPTKAERDAHRAFLENITDAIWHE
ncbi:MAG: DNA polymerase III subunit epsilon [Rickettsiales bacterium]|jgi:DNA polymerase-3 subunit epsilon|nr:DNA polymerase III subunit epsilon [Rickettsiales bacterium]